MCVLMLCREHFFSSQETDLAPPEFQAGLGFRLKARQDLEAPFRGGIIQLSWINPKDYFARLCEIIFRVKICNKIFSTKKPKN